VSLVQRPCTLAGRAALPLTMSRIFWNPDSMAARSASLADSMA
jgi:hypothetical protein